MKAEDMKRLQLDLKKCKKPHEIERVFQAYVWSTKSETARRRVFRACNERATEIAPTLRQGHLLPRRKDKGKGCSALYEMNGVVYRTGVWGNGPGYRWAMVAAREWMEGELKKGGLRSRRKIETIIEWTIGGYYWRALKELVT